MAENYFPRAEDFDEMGDHLEVIARVLVNKVEISDWESIQKAVRTGVAPDVLPVGTQLVANHSVYGKIKLDVVAHNHYESADLESANTMTLMCHDIITSIRFDEPEAFYYAEEELPAGTYHFFVSSTSSNAGQFTLDQPLAKGGQLFIYGNPNYSIDSSEILAYDNMSQTVPRTYSITVGTAGVSLGTLGVELNSRNRVFYGSNNYKESALRQFVNSSAEAGKVWTPQTKFDFRPQWLDALAGFAYGLDSGLKRVIGSVVVPCKANIGYESPDSTLTPGQKYTLTDKFYIPSETEISGTEGVLGADGTTLLPYFKGSLYADRVKYSGAYASKYWLRNISSADRVNYMDESGRSLSTNYPSESLGVVPMFNIV